MSNFIKRENMFLKEFDGGVTMRVRSTFIKEAIWIF
jgi:hypothetical protein